MRYPRLVEVAWNTVNALVAEWQATPLRWYVERDLQMELAARLQHAYDGLGEGTFQACSEHYRGVWSRVSCEPTVTYRYNDGKDHVCYPDVVVWEKSVDSSARRSRWEWPILWACELKYQNLGTTPSQKPPWDIEKMTYLLQTRAADTGPRLRFGCWLSFNLKPPPNGRQPAWQRSGDDYRLWQRDLFVGEETFASTTR